MNERIKEIAEQCYETGPIGKDGWPEYSKFNEEKFAELIIRECVNVMLNTDEQKFVVEIEGWELGGANHNAWDRGILDAVATVKEHFGVEE
jgi:hypothetical protein